MFTSSPRFSTLAQQVSRILEDEIRRGVYRETLPGERQLAASFQVSRRTIRAATEILRRQKLILTTHGADTKILEQQPHDPDPRSMRSIGEESERPEDLKTQQGFLECIRQFGHGTTASSSLCGARAAAARSLPGVAARAKQASFANVRRRRGTFDRPHSKRSRYESS